jgi:hypothetical protein
MEIAALAERDQSVHHAAQVLGLRQRRLDLLVLDQGRRHIGEHGLTMSRRAAEPAAGKSVTHDALSSPNPGFAHETDGSSRRRSPGPRMSCARPVS